MQRWVVISHFCSVSSDVISRKKTSVGVAKFGCFLRLVPSMLKHVSVKRCSNIYHAKTSLILNCFKA